MPGVHPHRPGRVHRGDRGRAVRPGVGHRAGDRRVPGRLRRQRGPVVAVLPPQRGGGRAGHRQLGRPGAAGPLRLSPDPPGDGGRDHRGRGGGPACAPQPGAVGTRRSPAMVLGGTALFLLGHAAFKAAIWGRVSRTRIGGVVVLAALGGLAPTCRRWSSACARPGRGGRGRRRLADPRRPRLTAARGEASAGRRRGRGRAAWAARGRAREISRSPRTAGRRARPRCGPRRRRCRRRSRRRH